MTTAQFVRVEGEDVTVRGDLRTARVAEGGDYRRRRVLDAARACVAARGLAGTTADDIARGAGCSRATVYRIFPGGFDAVMAAMAADEVARCLDEVGRAMDGAGTLVDALVAGIATAGRLVTGHPLLTRLLAEEPGVILPLLTFDHEERILAAAGRWAAPRLRRWLAPAVAARTAAWAARIVDVYALDPSAAHRLADEAWVRRLVTRTILPGVRAMAPHPDGASGPNDTTRAPGPEASPGGPS